MSADSAILKSLETTLGRQSSKCEEGKMTDAAIRNIVASEFRVLQQRILDRTITKADLANCINQMSVNMPSKTDINTIRNSLEEIKFELRTQRQMIKQHSMYIESLSQNTRNNTNQLGSLWRFVQQ
jgi:hypothetical protein